MTIKKAVSDPVKVAFMAKSATQLSTSDIGRSTAKDSVKGVKYANGDGYIGELKNGRRHGDGTYAFASNIKVQVTRLDKSVLTHGSYNHKAGTILRTEHNKPSGELTAGRTQYAVENRPVEEFQGAKLAGKWKNDELVEGTVKVLNRQGSVKEFNVNAGDLNLLASPVEGQHLTMRTWEGASSVPAKLNPHKEKISGR